MHTARGRSALLVCPEIALLGRLPIAPVAAPIAAARADDVVRGQRRSHDAPCHRQKACSNAAPHTVNRALSAWLPRLRARVEFALGEAPGRFGPR